MKQTSSFQRWHKRYFKILGKKLLYGKDEKVSTLINTLIHPLISCVYNDDETLSVNNVVTKGGLVKTLEKLMVANFVPNCPSLAFLRNKFFHCGFE